MKSILAAKVNRIKLITRFGIYHWRCCSGLHEPTTLNFLATGHSKLQTFRHAPAASSVADIAYVVYYSKYCDNKTTKRHLLGVSINQSINQSIKSSFIEEKPLLTQMQEGFTIELKKLKN